MIILLLWLWVYKPCRRHQVNSVANTGHLGQISIELSSTHDTAANQPQQPQPQVQPQPQSPHFGNSNYRREYGRLNGAPIVDRFLQAVDAIVRVRAPSGAAADDFMQRLQANVDAAVTVAQIAVRVWISHEWLLTSVGNTKEFCSLVNEAIRDDGAAVGAADSAHAAVIAKALAVHLVTRQHPHARWPPLNRTFRGTAMPRVHQAFFQQGLTYRAPMFVATSFNRLTVETFLRRLPASTPEQTPQFQEPTVWTFHYDEARRCCHVNYIEYGDEQEFLFMAYSVFTVRNVTWQLVPTQDNPHRIDVEVAADNQTHPHNLANAPWC